LKAELDACRRKNAELLRAPSLTRRQEPARMNEKGVATSGGRDRKLYSEALGFEINLKSFKLTVKPKVNQSSVTIKDY
jgi:hypothetical protein